MDANLIEASGLTADSLDVFLQYVDETGNWGSCPWTWTIEPTKAQRGNISDLVKKGLIEVMDNEGKGRFADSVVCFTEAGYALAEKLGVTIY